MTRGVFIFYGWRILDMAIGQSKEEGQLVGLIGTGCGKPCSGNGPCRRKSAGFLLLAPFTFKLIITVAGICTMLVPVHRGPRKKLRGPFFLISSDNSVV